MEHTKSKGSEDENMARVLRAGYSAALRHGLQRADVDACAADFGGHMANPARWKRWVELEYSNAWLNACAGNYAKNYLSLLSSTAAHEMQESPLASQLLQIVDSSADPDRQLQRKEGRSMLDAAVAQLSNRQRTAISLRYDENCSFSEIATALGITEDAASKLIRRALLAMRSRLARTSFDPESALGDFAPPPQTSKCLKKSTPKSWGD